jgi:hypothetical protein
MRPRYPNGIAHRSCALRFVSMPTERPRDARLVMTEELRDGLLEREDMDRHAFVSAEVGEHDVEPAERREDEKAQEHAHPRGASSLTREAMKVTPPCTNPLRIASSEF